jgi:hypothetical protein
MPNIYSKPPDSRQTGHVANRAARLPTADSTVKFDSISPDMMFSMKNGWSAREPQPDPA